VFDELVSFLEGLLAFLARERSGSAALAGVDGSAAAVALLIAGADAPGLEPGDALEHFGAVRKQLVRLHVIQRTDFLEAGYTLVDLFLFVTVSATVLCRFDNPVEAQVVVAFTSLQFLYMKHLVHDIDAPFSYAPDDLLPVVRDGELAMDHPGGSASIDVFPLIETLRRLRARTAHAASAGAAPVAYGSGGGGAIGGGAGGGAGGGGGSDGDGDGGGGGNESAGAVSFISRLRQRLERVDDALTHRRRDMGGRAHSGASISRIMLVDEPEEGGPASAHGRGAANVGVKG